MSGPSGSAHGSRSVPLCDSVEHPEAQLVVADAGAGLLSSDGAHEGGHRDIYWFKPSGGNKVHLSWERCQGLCSRPLCRAVQFRFPDEHRGIGFEQASSGGDLCTLCSSRFWEWQAGTLQ